MFPCARFRFVVTVVCVFHPSRFVPCREYDGTYFGSGSCGFFGYDCLDPTAPNDCATESPTPSPAAGAGYPGCEGYIFNIGDGDCDDYNNNEECEWDGGRQYAL